MGIMNKIKKNTSDLGKISKNIVDQNKLRMQASNKKKEVRAVKQKIGETMFEHFLSNRGVPEDILLDCQQLEGLLDELSGLEKEIKEYGKEINSYSNKLNEDNGIKEVEGKNKVHKKNPPKK